MTMKREFYVICHNVRSRENVGSIFRTADAFGVAKIFLTGYTPAPPHHKISKAALGAENWVPWEKFFSASRLIKKLKKEGFFVAGLEQHRRSLKIENFKKMKKPLALVLGNEVNGLPADVLKQCDVILEIPMAGKKESLNVAVAFGVAAYLLSR